MATPSYSASENTINAKTITDAEVKEMLVQKSVEAFPEFEKEIRGENLDECNWNRAREIGFGEVVYTETRMLSETESVTYTEFDSGIALTAFGLMEGKNITDTYENGTETTYTMNVWLQYGASLDVLFVEDLIYSIRTNQYDVIRCLGDINHDYSTSSYRLDEYRTYENTSENAYVEYGSFFNFSVNYGDMTIPYSLHGTLRIEVGDDKCVISSY